MRAMTKINENQLKEKNLQGGVWNILNKYGIYTVEEALKVGETLSLNIGIFTVPLNEEVIN